MSAASSGHTCESGTIDLVFVRNHLNEQCDPMPE